MIPPPLREMLDDGVITEVIRPLKSGKEASVYIVVASNRFCAAKVYKAMERRNFRNRADYVEGRQVGDSRQQRAMDSGSRFGKQQSEIAWQSHEADALRRLHAAGVRVPEIYQRYDGVILMELIVGADGETAPQLASARFSRPEALHAHGVIMRQIARMLCAGLVHGDLSEHNILLAHDGPLIIDLPQAVEVASNNGAKRLLVRDIANLTRFFSRFIPEIRRCDYAGEMWLLHETRTLTPETPLTGRHQEARQIADAAIVLREIEAAKRDAAKREEIRLAREDARRAPR